MLIPAEWAGHALSGDIVKVAPAGSIQDIKTGGTRPAGKVVEIISRARETFVGTLIEENGLTLLQPDYKKMYVPLVILERGDVPLGYKVVVRLGEWATDKEYPLGVIEEVIGTRACTMSKCVRSRSDKASRATSLLL